MPEETILPISEANGLEGRSLKAQVFLALDEAKRFAKTLDFDDVKSEQWFINLLRRVVYTYDRNARAKYFPS